MGERFIEGSESAKLGVDNVSKKRYNKDIKKNNQVYFDFGES